MNHFISSGPDNLSGGNDFAALAGPWHPVSKNIEEVPFSGKKDGMLTSQQVTHNTLLFPAKC